MKKILSLVFIVCVQIFIVGMFFNKILGNKINVYENISVIRNDNLDKIATSVSVLFDGNQDAGIVMVDDSIIEDLPSLYEDVSNEPVRSRMLSVSSSMPEASGIPIMTLRLLFWRVCSPEVTGVWVG